MLVHATHNVASKLKEKYEDEVGLKICILQINITSL